MLTCDRCRAALLDRQYGLLDAAEATAVDAHLAACPACQAEQTASRAIRPTAVRRGPERIPGRALRRAGRRPG